VSWSKRFGVGCPLFSAKLRWQSFCNDMSRWNHSCFHTDKQTEEIVCEKVHKTQPEVAWPAAHGYEIQRRSDCLLLAPQAGLNLTTAQPRRFPESLTAR
jgi:hypothetical protein